MKSPHTLNIAVCGASGIRPSELTAHLRRCAGASPQADSALPVETHSDITYHSFASRHRHFLAMEVSGLPSIGSGPVIEALANADVAIIFAQESVKLSGTGCLHAQLASELGVPHLILAIEQQTEGESLHCGEDAATEFLTRLKFASITQIPLSTVTGDNIGSRSSSSTWHTGPTLLACLENLPVSAPRNNRLVFPVQLCLDADDVRLLGGAVQEGGIQIGETLRTSGPGATTRATRISSATEALAEAKTGDAVSLATEPALDIQRGDILSHAGQPLETTDQFEATLLWIGNDPGLAGRTYEIRLANQWTRASITTLKSRLNVMNHTHEAARQLSANEIGVARLALESPLVFDRYASSTKLGSFTLVDVESRLTVAAGLIRHSLRRAQNVHWQLLSITRKNRELQNGHPAKVVWFTGLSGSGKSTLANALEMALHGEGKRTYILDGDNVRQGLNKDLGFTDADRVENIRRIAEVSKLMMDAGLIVMTAFISPFRREREMARDLIGADNFIEVFVSTPLETCEERDPKGLYKKARNGQIPNMTGIGSPYEAPENPTIVIDASRQDVKAATQTLLKLILRSN